jgi:hypothetical protein
MRRRFPGSTTPSSSTQKERLAGCRSARNALPCLFLVVLPIHAVYRTKPHKNQIGECQSDSNPFQFKFDKYSHLPQDREFS